MSETVLLSDPMIFNEMLSHPALFTHQHPQNIAILGDKDHGILHEVLKHDKVLGIHCDQNIANPDPRIHSHPANWFEKCPANTLDILINTTAAHSPTTLKTYFNRLHHDGILIQLCDSLFALDSLKSHVSHIRSAGFSDLHIIHFPQPTSKIAWRSAVMALKNGVFKRAREKAIYNKTFKTQYYNHDVHRAALAVPECIREELCI